MSIVRFSTVSLLALLLSFASLTAGGQEETADLWMAISSAFHNGDRLEVAGLIAAPGSDAVTVSRYFDVERALYWQGRDLPAAMYVAEQGIAYCLARAVANEANPALAIQLRAAAGRIAFNLASSTWPGWNEPGIVISDSQREVGMEAARLALSISEDLNAGPGPLANGHWMLAAHERAAGRYREAEASFRRAALFGRAAEDRGTELVSEGFVSITQIVAGIDAEDARSRLEQVRATLEAELEDAEFWTGQFDTAWRVFVEPLP
jgi:hypothetical protein